jgi:peptidoglycan L-alanyl-D-glutamate endopeptidase CwlK
MTKANVQSVNRDETKLAPFFAHQLKQALIECRELGYKVAMFEGYRSPERQQWLYDQGRTRDGKIITYAKPYESFHQLGLAADIVGFDNGKWSWDINYKDITEILNRFGFETLKFEKAHFQITGGLSVSKAVKIAKHDGMLHLWSIVEQSLK